VESALARIHRAQTKGKKDVKLNREELAALERRRDRLQDEWEQRRRKDRERRFAVPISQLEPTSRKRRQEALPYPPDDIPSGSQERTNHPPMGHFPSPSARHVSDTAARPRSRGPLPHEKDWVPGLYSSRSSQASTSVSSIPSSSRQSQHSMDPFQYMTSGHDAPYHGAQPSSHRQASRSVSDVGSGSRPIPRHQGDSTRLGSQNDECSEETSSEEATSEDGSEDEHGDASAVRSKMTAAGSSNRRRSRDDLIVVEEISDSEPEHISTPEPDSQRERSQSSRRSPKKKSSGPPSPIKRKPVGSSSSGKKRKGK
jgi:hypothetical protein